jgi:hypothetical protein
MEKIYTFVKAQGPKGRIKQLFKAINDASSLEACQDHLERSLIAFRVRIFIAGTPVIDRHRRRLAPV